MRNDRQAMESAMRMAQSATGQELLRLLQQSSGQQLNRAMEKAVSGDYSEAKAILEQLLQDPRARKLLDGMGGIHGKDGR